MHPELIQFILPLRSKNLPIKLLKWIVILTPNIPQEIHDTLSKFPKIVFIQGDPLYSDNLMRANIITADIAIILGDYPNMDNSDNDNYEIIGRENEEQNEEKKEDENNANDSDDLMEDSRVLYVYKSIKKLNSSIQIITELLHSNNIELLLNSKSLKKLYKDSKNIHIKNNSPQTQISDENDYNSNLNYDITPVYAAGEVYLPTVIDRITAQISYNSNLLTILNLILIGEKPPEKAADKKLAQMIELSGSNLYLIPSEPKSESFNDMFKRLLIKYSMISIALYRKNEQENFYYVYTNPKKTTLVRKNDMVFVLSSTENLISYYEKNLFLVDQEHKIFHNDDADENNKTNNDINNPNNDSNLISENNPTLTKAIQEAVEQQSTTKNDPKFFQRIEKAEKKLSHDNNVNNNILNLFENKEKKMKKYNSVFNKNELKRGKYYEIDSMQHRLDKGIEKLKMINEKCNNIYKDVDKFVNEEIASEFSVYISNNNNMAMMK
jgi:Trk K+ transport system NAD-binding subunit